MIRRIASPQWYIEDKKFIDYAVSHYLGVYFNENHDETLSNFTEMVYYSTRWWKRIRAIFALEFYLHFSNKKLEDIQIDDDIVKVCIAIECLHSYSLVHDDLPCMDNDTYRRWELTTWKKYWETNAVLVWDLLNSLSFEILWDLDNTEIWYKLISMFWRSVWLHWMLWWQVLDLYYEKHPKIVTTEKLIETHNKKTWALITFSMMSWILLSDYKWSITDFVKFSNYVWLAFQVKDDILDKEWTFEETGKSVWNEQKWFIELIWLNESEKYLHKLTKDALAIIAPYNIPNIEFLVKYLAKRKR